MVYKGNKASESGGGIYFYVNCSITFGGNSKLTFTKNEAKHVGGMYFREYSNILFHDNASVMYTDNAASKTAGGIYLYKKM